MKCCFCGGDAGKYGNNARPLKDGFCCDKCNATKVIPARFGVVPIKAKWIRTTFSSMSSKLDRWECPNCRKNKKAECRFNLNWNKRGRIWVCRFCKTTLLLEGKNA